MAEAILLTMAGEGGLTLGKTKGGVWLVGGVRLVVSPMYIHTIGEWRGGRLVLYRGGEAIKQGGRGRTSISSSETSKLGRAKRSERRGRFPLKPRGEWSSYNVGAHVCFIYLSPMRMYAMLLWGGG